MADTPDDASNNAPNSAANNAVNTATEGVSPAAGLTWFRDRVGGTYYPGVESVRRYLFEGRTVVRSGPPANELRAGQWFLARITDITDGTSREPDILCEVVDRDRERLAVRILVNDRVAQADLLREGLSDEGWVLEFDPRSGRSSGYRHETGRLLQTAAPWHVEYTGAFPPECANDYQVALRWAQEQLAAADAAPMTADQVAAISVQTTTGLDVHPAVRRFIDHFRKADALGRDRPYADTRLFFDEPTGVPDNEVFRGSWTEDDGTAMVMRLTEEDIIGGRWEGAAFLCDDREGQAVQLTGFALEVLAPPAGGETQGERGAVPGEADYDGLVDPDEDDGEPRDDGPAPPVAVAPQDIAIVTEAAGLPVMVVSSDRWPDWKASPASLVERLRLDSPDRVAVFVAAFDGQLGVYMRCESHLRLARPGETALRAGASDAHGDTPLDANSLAAAMTAWQSQAATVASEFRSSCIFITQGDTSLLHDRRACLCAFTPLVIDEQKLVAASPYGRDDGALAMLADVLYRLAEGTAGREALGQAARVQEQIRAVGQSPAYVLVQEGGSSGELYLHAWGSLGEAEEDRISCSKDGAYRTGEVVEISPGFAEHPEFYDVAEALMRKACGGWYEETDAVVPVTLACHPDFWSATEAIAASVETLECVGVPDEQDEERESSR